MRRLIVWAAVLGLLALGGGMARASNPATPSPTVPVCPTSKPLPDPCPKHVSGVWSLEGTGNVISGLFLVSASDYILSFDMITGHDSTNAGVVLIEDNPVLGPMPRATISQLQPTTGHARLHGEVTLTLPAPMWDVFSVTGDGDWTVALRPVSKHS